MKTKHHHDHHLSSSMTSSTAGPAAPPQASHDEIARRAFELFCQRGGQGGSADEDWLAAERDLRSEAASS